MSHRLFAILCALAFGCCGVAPAHSDEPARPVNDDDTVFLVAQPEFQEASYRHTVLIAAPVASGGHVGVIINRSTGRKLISFFPRQAPSNQVSDAVRYGGPYSPDALVAVVRTEHSPGEGSLPLLRNLYIAFHADIIDKLIADTPNAARYYVGHVGWQPGELKAEIDRGLWAVVHADRETVFRADTSGLWEELIAQSQQIHAGTGGRSEQEAAFAAPRTPRSLRLATENVEFVLRLFEAH